MQYKSTERLKITTFKLNALLSVTQAINQNLPVDELLNHYCKILQKDLNIGKVLIVKRNKERWECLIKAGYAEEICNKIDVERDLLPFTDITFITSSHHPALEGTDIVIPVYNNNIPLAYVLIGDIDEEGEGVSPTIKHLHFIQTLSNIIIVAIENIRLFEESLRQEALRKELELASKMQNMLIPDPASLPRREKIRFVAFYHPHMDVGGDYYDVLELGKDETGFCIADVSGKGISAALLMSNFQANLQALFSARVSLETLVTKLNDRVMKNAKGEKFVTLFVARYNEHSGELEYINAAHNPPLLYLTDQKKVLPLTQGCVGIGMLDEIPRIQKGNVSIKGRSKLLCFTDGLVELIDEKNIINAASQVETCLANDHPIEDNLRQIIEEFQIHSKNPRIFDDVTILGVEFS